MPRRTVPGSQGVVEESSLLRELLERVFVEALGLVAHDALQATQGAAIAPKNRSTCYTAPAGLNSNAIDTALGQFDRMVNELDGLV